MYDNRRVAARSMDDSRIFSLGNFFGLAQRHSIVNLLQMFMCPHSHLLPISVSSMKSLSTDVTYLVQQINSFVKFLQHQMAKELVYHVVYLITATCHIHLTIADLEPHIFRNATNPPVDTLALVASCVSAFCFMDALFMFVFTQVLSSAAGKTHSHLGCS